MIPKKMKISAFALIALLAVAQTTMARDFAEIYVDCGLGALIAPRLPVVAVITNVIWDLGTTAIISNSSSPETCKGENARTAAFIHDSYEPLEKDLARGKGEYLDTLMVMTGCSEESQQALSRALRVDFGSFVATHNYTNQTKFQKSENLYNLLYNQVEGHFSKSCTDSKS